MERIEFILFSKIQRQLLSPQRRNWLERGYSVDSAVHLEEARGPKTAHQCQENKVDGAAQDRASDHGKE